MIYRENALVTFATHDLPTFAGWASGHDLTVMHGLGLDPGVSDGERIAAHEAMGRAMAWQGLPAVDYFSILKFLADTPSRLLAVTDRRNASPEGRTVIPANAHPSPESLAALVTEALQTLMQGRTVLMISHDLDRLRDADRIVVLENGHLVQEGEYAEMSLRVGLFRELVEYGQVR